MGTVVVFFQSEERKMVSGNSKGNSNLILPFQERLVNCAAK